MEYSILSGWLITPWVKSILAQKQIDGLVMDITWEVKNQSMTAVLMALFYNVGIPIAMAFGAAKIKELAEMFWRSMFLIVSIMSQKTQSFQVQILPSFNNTFTRARRRARQIPINPMTAECKFFCSSRQHCDYAETELHSKMFLM
jgi:hypothetical protein